jgi:hypothetical protein
VRETERKVLEREREWKGFKAGDVLAGRSEFGEIEREREIYIERERNTETERYRERERERY